MTVVVGYLAGKCGHAPLNLGVELAHLLRTDLAVVAVVPGASSTRTAYSPASSIVNVNWARPARAPNS